MIIAMIIKPSKYGTIDGFDMAMLSLSGIVGFYFGGTEWQTIKRSPSWLENFPTR